MAFTGNLIMLQDVNTIGTNNPTYTTFPVRYIRYETYQVTPNQRMDLDTGLRDLNGVMHRNVVPHTATKIEFETTLLRSEDVEHIMYILREHWVHYLERDVWMMYFCPEGERPDDVSAEYGDYNASSYKYGHFYMPDIQFGIRNVDRDTVIDSLHPARRLVNYQQIRFAFIEY